MCIAVAIGLFVAFAAAGVAAGAAGLVGTWYGINGTVGTLQLKASHTYVYNARSRGSWKAIRGGVLFTGPLTAWNHGRATLKNGVMEFYWTTAAGAKQYFVFEKG